MSNKNIINYLTVFLALFIIFTPFSGAIQEDFHAFTNSESLEVCACDLKSDKITITNTGDVTSTFRLEKQGGATPWSTLAPEIFYLEPGKQQTVTNFIKVPCSARGKYSLNTQINTLFDTKKELKQTLNVKNCANVQITPKFNTVPEVCPCTPVQYNFEIKNSGNHIETYDLSISPKTNGVSLSSDFLILEPGQKQKIIAFVSLDCGIYQNKTFTLNAKARNTEMLGQLNFQTKIKKCYEYSLRADKNINVCKGVYSTVPFNVINNAKIGNQYELSINGPKWAKLINTSVAIWGDQTKKAYLAVVPESYNNASKYKIDIFAKSSRGDIKQNTSMILNLKDCYDYSLLFEKTALKTTQCESKNHGVILKNTGTKNSTFYVDVWGLSWANTNKNTPINLMPGAKQELFMHTDTPCNLNGEFPINLVVKFGGFPDLNKTSKHNMQVFTKNNARLLDIPLTDKKINYNGTKIPVKFTNKGYLDSKYSLSLTASKWITLDKYTLDLKSGESETINLNIYPSKNIKEDIYAAKLIAISNNTTYSQDFDVRLSTSILTDIWFFALSYWIFILILAILLLLIIILLLILIVKRIRKKKKRIARPLKTDKKPKQKNMLSIDKKTYEQQEPKKKKLWPVLLAIIIIVLLIGLGAGTYLIINSIDFDKSSTTNNDKATKSTETIKPVPTPTTTKTTTKTLPSLISIDRSSIPGKGNVLYVKNASKIKIPLTIKNPNDRKSVFNAKTDSKWVKFEYNDVVISAQSSQKINIEITPDMNILKEKDYKIKITSLLSGNSLYREETIDLVVSKEKTFWENWWSWLILGLIILALILSSIFLIKYISKRPKKPKSVTKKNKIITNKDLEKPKAKNNKTWWKILLVIAAIVIVLGLIIGTGYFALNTLKNTFKNNEDKKTSVQKIPQVSTPNIVTKENSNEPLIKINRSQISGSGTVLEIKKQVSIPITIKNPTNRKAVFTVKTNNATWIKFAENNVFIPSNQTKTINMSITPNLKTLSNKNYKIAVKGSIKGTYIDYEETLGFTIKKKGFDKSWLYYILAGLILLLILIIALEVIKSKNAVTKPKKSKKIQKEKKQKYKMLNKEVKKIQKRKTKLKIKKL